MTEAISQETVAGGTIEITPTAAERLHEEMGRREEPPAGLRLMVFPGGCAGLQYALSFARGDPDGIETIVESRGIKVFVQEDALELLAGSRIDWVDNLIGGGFRVENPNAQQSCGCGKSFS